VPLEGWPGQLPAGFADRIFFGELSGSVRCVQPSTGRTLWVRDLEAPASLFIVLESSLLAIAYYEASGTGDGETARPVAPSWHVPGAKRSCCLYLLGNSDGSVLAKFPGQNLLMVKLVTPYGIVAQEDIGGPVSCFPATIAPTEDAP